VSVAAEIWIPRLGGLPKKGEKKKKKECAFPILFHLNPTVQNHPLDISLEEMIVPFPPFPPFFLFPFSFFLFYFYFHFYFFEFFFLSLYLEENTEKRKREMERREKERKREREREEKREERREKEKKERELLEDEAGIQLLHPRIGSYWCLEGQE